MTGDLDGRVAIVTGSGNPKGIGAASARALGEAGARVVVADLTTSAATEVAQQMRDDGLEAIHGYVDITDENSVRALIGHTLETFGALDVLDNNAAATHLVPHDRGLVDMTVDLWDNMFAVVARGTMLMCKHAIPSMVKQRRGSIINISSGRSLAGDRSEAAQGAAKAAVNSLTRSVATMYGKDGVRCNTVSPGVIESELMRAVVPEELQAITRDNNLVPYLGDPRDIANLVVFLASDRSAYITGQLIPVDGGFSSHVPTFAAGAHDPESQFLIPLGSAS